ALLLAAHDDVVELRLDGLELVDVFRELIIDAVELAWFARGLRLSCGCGSGIGNAEALVYRREDSFRIAGLGKDNAHSAGVGQRPGLWLAVRRGVENDR